MSVSLLLNTDVLKTIIYITPTRDLLSNMMLVSVVEIVGQTPKAY
jgi:hypothetical protein